MPLSFSDIPKLSSGTHESSIPKLLLGADMSADNAVTKGVFAYRQHSDGSIAAICLRCYANAATANTLSKLASLEAQHRCAKANGAKLLNRAGTQSPQTMMSQK